MLVEGAYTSAFAVPLLPSTEFPVQQTSCSVRRPSSPTAKLDTELSPPLVVKRQRSSDEGIMLYAPSKALGALSSPLIGLNTPEPEPPVEVRSTSVTVPSGCRRKWMTAFCVSFVCM